MIQFTLTLLVVIAGLFMALLASIEIGRCAGRRRKSTSQTQREGIGVLDGAMFALLGFLIALTFSGATLRFDLERQLVVDEANALRTAYSRLDILPAVAQPLLRAKFREYTRSRLEAFRKLPNLDAMRTELKRAGSLQTEIWSLAISASIDPALKPERALVLPALNAMFDIANSRTIATETHPPVIIFGILVAVALISSYLVGDIMANDATRNWLHTIAFALVVALTFYVIVDIEFPRLGLVRIEAFDRVLVDALDKMR